MNRQTRSVQRSDIDVLPNSLQRKGLRLLNQAWLAAHEDGQNVWQFAVAIDQLLALGLIQTDLRHLLSWGYLQHAQERTTARNRHRVFQPLQALALPKRTCFVLTAKGRKLMAESSDASTGEPGRVPKVPHWDGEARQLWWGEYLVKKFHRPAANQELVLAALEEEGWPPQIDDPLPRTKNIDPKVRLHDTIKALNRHQQNRILHFGSVSNGRAIRWSLLE